MIRSHGRMLLKTTLGTLVGGALGALSLTGATAPEGLVTAAIATLVLGIMGWAVGIVVALRGSPRGWVVVAGSVVAMGLEYLLIRSLLPQGDWVEALGGDTWALLVAGSLLVFPQVVLGLTEVADRLPRRERGHPSVPDGA